MASLSQILGLLFAVVAAYQSLAAPPPAQFTPNPRVGRGGTQFRDSAHFRVYGAQSAAAADSVIRSLEAAYECFVDGLGWRSTGLSINVDHDNGPWYKLNVYNVASLPGAAANTGSDMTLGYSFLNVVTQYMNESTVTVHEFGHALTYAARYWIYQTRTGAWWETIANFVTDTFVVHDVCAEQRRKYGQAERDTIMDLRKVLGSSHQVIVDGTRDTANHYQAWPFFTYLTNNPDNYTGMGWQIFPGVWDRYKRDSDETPLHVLERLASPTRIQAIVARYWARMAYVDVGHPQAQAMFSRQRSSIGYSNLDPLGGGRYRVKTARQPRYMGANIIPLRTQGGGTADISVTVTANAAFSATLAVRGAGEAGSVRYLELAGGSGRVSLVSGEEASLVIANTPASLLLFDPFKLSAEANRGLDYQIQITGATA